MLVGVSKNRVSVPLWNLPRRWCLDALSTRQIWFTVSFQIIMRFYHLKCRSWADITWICPIIWGCSKWEWDHKESWAPKNGCFELWCWRRFLRVPWAAGRSNQSILKEVNSEYSLNTQTWCWSRSSNTLATWCEEPTHLKSSDAGKGWGQEEKGMTEDEMVREHHWLSGHEANSRR